MPRAFKPQQRKYHTESLRLSHESAQRLQPLHDELAALFPSFDGIVYFAIDTWHKNNASAVVTVQPQSDDIERFGFYKQNIAHRRVDLGASALGEGLLLRTPTLLSSRMNPKSHTTIVHRVIINGKVVGGLQTAFNAHYGTLPTSADEINRVWEKHKAAVLRVGRAFDNFATKVRSIGDVLELNAPATPNAYMISWDLRGSTLLGEAQYGALRNYLIDTKLSFEACVSSFNAHFHDNGDGQDIAILLPEVTAEFDRADPKTVRRFGVAKVIPLVHTLLKVHDNIAKTYADIAPHIAITVGLGYVEHDVADARTSAEFWQTAKILKSHPAEIISYTPNAQRALFPTNEK